MNDSCLLTIDSKLDSFLAAEIAIPQTARSAASTSQNRLRQLLQNKSHSDSGFPRILSYVDNDFIGGSFARYTKIWPLDDIDLYFPIDGSQLSYNINGLRAPYTLMTDNPSATQPLIKDQRWLSGPYIASDLVLDGFLQALKISYPSSTIREDKHAVCLRTTIDAASESTVIGFDIVPCFALLPDVGKQRIYLIPDGNGGWLRTNPRIDSEICSELHNYHYQSFRKVVRLIKYWNKHSLSDQFSSYFIELAICRCFQELRNQGTALLSVVEALAWAFYGLTESVNNGYIFSFVQGAPIVNAPYLSPEQVGLMKASKSRAYGAWDAAMAGDVNGALYQLLLLLGHKFEAFN